MRKANLGAPQGASPSSFHYRGYFVKRLLLGEYAVWVGGVCIHVARTPEAARAAIDAVAAYNALPKGEPRGYCMEFHRVVSNADACGNCRTCVR